MRFFTAAISALLFTAGCVSACAQTVELVYLSTNPSVSYKEYFAYDYATGAATRIDAVGNIQTIDPNGVGSSGKAGAASLKPAEHLDFRNAIRMASVVMPQLIVKGIENDPNASLVTESGELGGPTYVGEYPTGSRLVSSEILKSAFNVPVVRVYYDLDDQQRLARIRYENSDRVQNFDLAEDSTAAISYVNSFGDGAWTLSDIRMNDSTDFDIFKPDYVAKLAQADAIEFADSKRTTQSITAATPEGANRIEQARDETLGTGLPQSTKRFALILTGLIVIAVGSLAWWKNRS